ncbi:MAG: hypothetical protein NT098_04420 [Candidatus Parcubacteria bacterium]|nr:hypothetical protein [Candidatus Parcubacteria bacterium]
MKIKTLSLIEHYITWHYGQAYSDIYHVWTNFIWFFFNFFSIKLLFSTLFSPWKRMGEEYPAGFDIGRAAQTWVVNILMRFVGAGVRLIVIAVGLSFALLAFLLGLVVLVVWTVMPIFFVALIISGFSLIIYG